MLTDLGTDKPSFHTMNTRELCITLWTLQCVCRCLYSVTPTFSRQNSENEAVITFPHHLVSFDYFKYSWQWWWHWRRVSHVAMKRNCQTAMERCWSEVTCPRPPLEILFKHVLLSTFPALLSSTWRRLLLRVVMFHMSPPQTKMWPVIDASIWRKYDSSLSLSKAGYNFPPSITAAFKSCHLEQSH